MLATYRVTSVLGSRSSKLKFRILYLELSLYFFYKNISLALGIKLENIHSVFNLTSKFFIIFRLRNNCFPVVKFTVTQTERLVSPSLEGLNLPSHWWVTRQTDLYAEK